MTLPETEKVVRSVCQACHCECGVLVEVTHGRVVNIKGDPAHPMNRGFVCVKGRAQPEVLYHPDRLLYPLKQTGGRGSGKWVRVSWDEALEEIAAGLTTIREKYGPESLATIHGTGPRPTTFSTVLLVCALGSPNVISVDNHICYLPSHIAEGLTLGASVTMEAGPDYLNSRCIVIIGGNPLHSHPPRGMDILEAKSKNGAKLIVVDPYRTELASKADLWLQVRPGTDVSLLLGMINIIIEEGLYDRNFVQKWCHGFEQLKQRAKEYAVERVAEITWIPADKIREAALMYATSKPAALHHRVATEQNVNSIQTSRACAILIALSGNLDVQGGNLLPMAPPKGYIPHPGRMFPIDPELGSKRVGADVYPLMSGPNAPGAVVLAPLAREAIHLGKPYPIKALWCGAGNPVVSMQNVRDVWQMLKDDLDLLVVADHFMTPTAELADYVLPAVTWMESDDTCNLMYMGYVAARQKVVEPLGECRHHIQMSIDLVKRLPWANRTFLPWNNVDEYNEALVRGMGMTFAEFKQKGGVTIPFEYRKYERNGFATATKKVELYCTVFENMGYDPLPWYREPPESPVSTPGLLDAYPLILYTGSRQIEFCASEGRQIGALRKRVPDPLVEIHPDRAHKLGINEGDWVWIETPQIKNERVRMRVRITESVHPEMVLARYGWWFPEKPGPEHGLFESNINVVMTDELPREEICGAVRTRGTLCRIYK